MKFNVVFIVTALLVSAAPATAVTLTFFTGADCAGSNIGVNQGSTAGECIYLPNDGLTRSISYSGVPNQIRFFEYASGIPGDCLGGANLVLGGGSGCGTSPPDGFNFESVSWD